MARRLRFLDNASGIVEVVSRTFQGRFLLRPSPEVNDIILGVLGRAQRKYGVELFAFVFMSNHFHILMRAESAKVMSDFMRYVKSNIALELGRLHGWKGTFWSARYTSIPLDDEVLERSLEERFFYIASNGTKENLVGSPLEFVGVSSLPALYRGEMAMKGTWYDRTEEGSTGEVCATEEIVRLSPLPCLTGPEGEELDADDARTAEVVRQYARYVIDVIERETRERHAAAGTRPVGAEAILRQNPLACPEEFEASPAPWFHCVSRDRYRELCSQRAATIAAYREAADRLKRGRAGRGVPGRLVSLRRPRLCPVAVLRRRARLAVRPTLWLNARSVPDSRVLRSSESESFAKTREKPKR